MKITGIIVKIEPENCLKSTAIKKISINTTLPNEQKNNVEEKIINLDKKMMKKLSEKEYGDEITEIKTYKPFYHNKRKDMIIKINILSTTIGLSRMDIEKMYGRLVEIISTPQMYVFNENKHKNIRGWKIKATCIK